MDDRDGDDALLHGDRERVRDALAAAIDRYGSALLSDPARLKLQLDVAGGGADVARLVAAAEQRIPQQLLRAPSDDAVVALLPKLVDALVHGGADRRSAVWTVRTWAYAFALPTTIAAPSIARASSDATPANASRDAVASVLSGGDAARPRTASTDAPRRAIGSIWDPRAGRGTPPAPTAKAAHTAVAPSVEAPQAAPAASEPFAARDTAAADTPASVDLESRSVADDPRATLPAVDAVTDWRPAEPSPPASDAPSDAPFAAPALTAGGAEEATPSEPATDERVLARSASHDEGASMPTTVASSLPTSGTTAPDVAMRTDAAADSARSPSEAPAAGAAGTTAAAVPQPSTGGVDATAQAFPREPAPVAVASDAPVSPPASRSVPQPAPASHAASIEAPAARTEPRDAPRPGAAPSDAPTARNHKPSKHPRARAAALAALGVVVVALLVVGWAALRRSQSQLQMEAALMRAAGSPVPATAPPAPNAGPRTDGVSAAEPRGPSATPTVTAPLVVSRSAPAEAAPPAGATTAIGGLDAPRPSSRADTPTSTPPPVAATPSKPSAQPSAQPSAPSSPPAPPAAATPARPALHTIARVDVPRIAADKPFAVALAIAPNAADGVAIERRVVDGTVRWRELVVTPAASLPRSKSGALLYPLDAMAIGDRATVQFTTIERDGTRSASRRVSLRATPPVEAAPAVACTRASCGTVVSVREAPRGFEIIVRMDDRSIRAAAQPSRWRAGTRVRLSGDQLLPTN